MAKIMINGQDCTSSSANATNINYNNSVSGLEATNVQSAIDKLLEWKVVGSTKGFTAVSIADVIDKAHEFMVVVRFMGSSSTELETVHLLPNITGLTLQRNAQGYFYNSASGTIATSTTATIVVTLSRTDETITLSNGWSTVYDQTTNYSLDDASVGVYYR